MLYTLLVIIYVFVVLLLIAVVLIQQPRGGGLGALGGMGGFEDMLGVRGAPTFFTKLTAVLGTLFFVLSLTLSAIHSPTKTQSALEKAQKTGTLNLPPVTPQQGQQGGQ